METKRYKIINTDNPDFGKKIKGIPTINTGNNAFVVTDAATGKVYQADEVRELPERHAAYMGVHIGRVGLFLFAR